MLMAAFQFELGVLEKCVNCSCPEPCFGGMQKSCCDDAFKLVSIQAHSATAKLSLLGLLLIGLINLCSVLSYSFPASMHHDSLVMFD